MLVEDKSRVDEVLKAIEELNSMYVVIGILSSVSGKMLMIASVQEFGTNIKVTQKMRGYLGYLGLHLRKDTEYIKIPERSYIRSSFDAKSGELLEKGDMLDEVLQGNITATEFYNILGQTCVQTIQDYLVELDAPPNHPLTVTRKHSSNPLVDTGHLMSSITYEIRSR